MNNKKILIAESNQEERQKLVDTCIESWGDKFEIISTECGDKACELSKDKELKLVISGFALLNNDGITLCEEVKKGDRVTFMMMASAFSDITIKRMTESGVDCYMIRPFSAEAFRKQVDFLIGAQDVVKNEVEGVSTQAAQIVGSFPMIANKQLEERISNIFITMGIPAHIKGYHFLREAVKIIVGNPALIGGITKELYPSIAKAFNTTSSKVERAIRHAIEVGWNRGRINQINEIFKVRAFDQKDRPTNGEFIALVADKLLLEGVS